MSKKILIACIYILVSVILISCKSEVLSEIINKENEKVPLVDKVKIVNQKNISEEEKDYEDTIVFSEKLVSYENINDMISSIYAYLYGEWTLAKYINLVWYPTGEENDEDLRFNYEEGYKEYLGRNFVFSEESILIPAYVDGVNIYNRSSDYNYKFSINKELSAPIVEVYGEIINEDDENVRFIFDGNGETYLEYKSYFFKIEKK